MFSRITFNWYETYNNMFMYHCLQWTILLVSIEIFYEHWTPQLISNTDCVITGMTDRLTLPSFAVGSHMDKDVGLQEPFVGTNTTGCHVTHHIYPYAGGRSSVQNVGLELHTYMASYLRKLDCMIQSSMFHWRSAINYKFNYVLSEY
jgi:hypothetical protein